MDNQCSMHITAPSIAYCAECDQVLCGDCFNTHSHFAISMKYYRGIISPIIEKDKCTRYSQLLTEAKTSLNSTIDSEISYLKEREKECEAMVTEVAKGYKLENCDMIVDKLKKKMSDRGSEFFSGIGKLVNEATTKLAKSITDGHNALKGVSSVSSTDQSPVKIKPKKDPKTELMLREAFKDKEAQKISITFKGIDSNGAIVLAEKLALMRNLSEIDLSGNAIKREGAIAIAESLKGMSKLANLSNQINRP